MFRKILLLILLLAGFSGWTQLVPPDHSCFNIDVDLNLHRERDENGSQIKDNYIVCRDQTVNIPPLLEVDYLRRTDQYQVLSNDYQSAIYPYGPNALATETDIWGENGVNLPWDDEASCVVDIGFKFSYFDQVFEKVVVWSNGIVRLYNGPLQCPSTNRDSYPPGTSPGGGPYGMPYMPNFYYGGIMGSYQHTHWNSNDIPEGRISYNVYGEAPCRKFVVTFYNMPPAGLYPDKCPPPVDWHHHQIVLHETTNVIDVNLIRHIACPATEPDNAAGIVGILSPDGSKWYVPHNKDFGAWDAVEESWRFAPSGEALFDIEWYVDNTLITTLNGDSPDLSLDLQIDARKEVRGCLVVETVPGERWVECYELNIRPAIEVDQLDLQPIICDKDQNSYDLNSITQMVKAAQTTSQAELEKLKFLYYNTQDDAKDKLNQITNIREFGVEEGKNPVFVRIESEIEECFEILQSVIIKAPVEVIHKPEVFLCDEYTLPVLTNDEFYYKIERLDENMEYIVKTIPDVYENMKINEAGYYRVYVKKTNQYGCEDVKSSLLMVESCKYPKGISPNYDGDNDYLDLTYNNVHELKIYNRHGKLVYEAGKEYKRQWAGQDMNDKLLPAGTYFLYVKTKNYEYQDWIQLIYESK